MQPTIRVAKVGGSLLTWNELPARLNRWLAQQSGITVLIAGGGPWAELLRHAAERFDLDDPNANWMCVQAMSVTASLLSDLAGVPCHEDLTELQNSIRESSQPVCVFDAQKWLANLEDLPETWDVTSDSIAARLAVALPADELVLLKSSNASTDDLEQLSVEGYVDPFFPQAAKSIGNVRFLNLREDLKK